MLCGLVWLCIVYLFTLTKGTKEEKEKTNVNNDWFLSYPGGTSSAFQGGQCSDSSMKEVCLSAQVKGKLLWSFYMHGLYGYGKQLLNEKVKASMRLHIIGT